MPTVAFRAVRGRRRIFEQFEKVAKKKLGAAVDAEVKPKVIELAEKRMEKWEEPAEIKARKFITKDSIEVTVFPAGKHKQKWIWLTKGTKGGYKIPKQPKTTGTLAFMWDGPGSYIPKTTPSGGYGGPGMVLGGEMHYPRQVEHPGIEARNFEEKIRKEYSEEFRRTMENIWRRTIRSL